MNRRPIVALVAALALGSGAQATQGRPLAMGGGRPGFKFLTSTAVACILATPQSILGAQLIEWWDLTDRSTMSPSTGSAIASVKGKIANTTASQATAANQPIYSATARNGKGGITVNNQYLDFTPTGFPSGSATTTLMVAGYSTSTVEAGIFGYGNPANVAWRWIGVNGGPQVVVGLYGSDQGTNINWLNTDLFVRWELTSAGASSVVGSGGTPSTTTLSAPNTALNVGSIGRYNGGAGQTATGTFQQAMVYSGAMTTRQKNLMDAWENWYDGRQGAGLPAGSTFATRAPCTSD